LVKQKTVFLTAGLITPIFKGTKNLVSQNPTRIQRMMNSTLATANWWGQQLSSAEKFFGVRFL